MSGRKNSQDPQGFKDSGLPPTRAPLPPFGQPGNQGKSALLRENFLCNIADAILPSGFFPDHYSHRRDTAYKTGNFKKVDVDAELAEDDWVNLTDKNTKPGPIKVASCPANSPERPSSMSGSSASPGFENAKLTAGPFDGENVAWAITKDTDMTPAVVGQPDNNKFVLCRYDIRDPAKIQKKRLELNIDDFDWDSEEHVARLNQSRRNWEVLTLVSNPQTSGKSRYVLNAGCWE